MNNDIPEDHPIHNVWADDARLDIARLRNPVFEGIIEMARDGDKQAVEILIDRFTKSVALGRPPHPEILEWIALALGSIRNGESADIAFGLKPGSGGKKQKRDSRKRKKRALVAAYILTHHEPKNPARTLAIVKYEAAKKYGVSEGDAQQIYDEWRVK